MLSFWIFWWQQCKHGLQQYVNEHFCSLFQKQEFYVVKSVNAVNSSKTLYIFEVYFKDKISSLSTLSTLSTARSLRKKFGFSEFFDVNSVNSVNSSKSLNIFESYFKNKIYMLSTVSTASPAVSLSTFLKHI